MSEFKYTTYLPNKDILRYSRQLLVEEIDGSRGQLALKSSTVCVIGAGGLGCPCLTYLASCGVGKIIVIDDDNVSLSNLNRQFSYSESDAGRKKAEVICEKLSQFNSGVQLIPETVRLTNLNALDILRSANCVVECTDNPSTRYCINDACVILGKPLVSGSAVRWSGQISVYNYNGGPCYRCIFPKPPPPEAVDSCNESGILGPVTGIIGSLQAIETVKILLNIDGNPNPQTHDLSLSSGVLSGRFLFYDGLTCEFTTGKLRPKSIQCPICSVSSQNTQTGPKIVLENVGCKKFPDIPPNFHLSVFEYRDLLEKKTPHVLIDVREAFEFSICSFSHALNVPLSTIKKTGLNSIMDVLSSELVSQKELVVVFMCQRSYMSRIAVKHLISENDPQLSRIKSFNLLGGIEAWEEHIDPKFPVYYK